MTAIQRAAKVLIRRASDGRYLVLTCSFWPENPRRSQKPDLPGGSIEPGEQIEEGLLREVREETGIVLTPEVLQLGHRSSHTQHDVQSNFLLYVAEVPECDEVVLSWEHESYQWLTREEVSALDIREPYKSIFEHFAANGLLK